MVRGNVADIYLVMAGIGVVVLIVLDVPFSRKDLDRIEHLGEDAGDVARDGESDGTADESQDSSAMVAGCIVRLIPDGGDRFEPSA